MIVRDKNKLIIECKQASLFEAPGIIEKLWKELSLNPTGVGLSANQIDIDAKICVIKFKEKIELVNPIIVNQYDLREFPFEGCLSFPGQQIKTKRFNEVFIKDNLHPNGIVSVGFEAVIIQHEIDHLYGRTMFDYEIKIPLPNEKCWCGEKKYKKCHMGKIIDG